MRLLRTGPYEPGRERLELIEKFGSQIPKYAILSHTWGDDEVTYEHVRAPTAFERAVSSNSNGVNYENIRDQNVRECKAYSKVVGAMRQAASDGHEYIWIDTCCIDKSSSVELSEAINSMNAWYQRAEVCYAILDGVPGPDAADFEVEFKASRWFTRGWTLQELLAPRQVVFFGRPLAGSWIMLGDRTSLRLLISSRTRIPTKCLTDSDELDDANIAQKMSWAAGRETTREEDLAYCLLGLFSVNMPLMYGEGPRAFMRLQEEIMKISDDPTIFAWMQDPAQDASEHGFEQHISYERLRDSELRELEFVGLESAKLVSLADTSHGLFADSPKAFLNSGEVCSWSNSLTKQLPYHLTNRGLSISLHLKPLSDDPSKNLYLADIGCCLPLPPKTKGEPDGMAPISVYLKRRSSPGVNQFARIRCEKLALIPEEDTLTPPSGVLTAIFVRQSHT
ncbi:hypothetical protein Q7P35_010313 [Cladosporium inversicolor]